MKSILENSECFEAYARIDFCYGMLDEIMKELSNPISPIERMIDNATGHGLNSVTKHRVDAIKLVEEIIRSKKIIEADYSVDSQTLDRLNDKIIS